MKILYCVRINVSQGTDFNKISGCKECIIYY